MGAGAAFTAALVIVLLVIGLRWYLKRARRVGDANDARRDFQRNLLLDLQDIRDGVDGELAEALDELIDMVRYDTPASSDATTELDSQISAEVQRLESGPTIESVTHLKGMLSCRNRRVQR